MTFALSTNWCNRRLDTGEAIVDEALALGFGALELGFHTTDVQVKGFRRRLGEMPVGSIHAYCPVPISAPQGYPELYSLACFDSEERAMARISVLRNAQLAAELGADTVVLHAGRVAFNGLFRLCDSSMLRGALKKAKGDTTEKAYAKMLAKARELRCRHGQRLMPHFVAELDKVLPEMQKLGVTLALENLPYLEGFPDEGEMAALLKRFGDSPLKSWFDTGHDRVRRMHGWIAPGTDPLANATAGMHINDVVDFEDDHLPPGEGKVDFIALREFASGCGHVVFEPTSTVTAERLASGKAMLEKAWGCA